MNQMRMPHKQDQGLNQITKIAVMAVGGQGGGVLTGWIETLARAQGYACQATSVAGVAQRTGATIYYIEMLPKSDKTPVFSLAPAEGDVDIVIAAEMMEVGRAIMRGFVTPDRTTLIGSTHRAYAVSEKMAPGNGMADAEEVHAAAEIAAQRLVLADMEELATRRGSVISSSLLGALAGSGVLPFEREAFESAIRDGGKGVEASLSAFEAGFEAAQSNAETLQEKTGASPPGITGPEPMMTELRSLMGRIDAFPAAVRSMARAGLSKVVDFQDCAYGAAYLDRLEAILEQDGEETTWAFSQAAAKHIANAMAYDDIIRVADLKTRAPRAARIREEMNATDQNLVKVTEYFHPRADEIISLMPSKMGARWESSPARLSLLKKIFRKGRRLRTDTLPAFLILNFLGGLQRYRLRTRRHAVEVAHLEDWLNKCTDIRETNYALAVELLHNRRLIKGYSDTHARGLNKFARVMAVADQLKNREDGAEWMARLRNAALQDEKGVALDGAIKTVESFTG